MVEIPSGTTAQLQHAAAAWAGHCATCPLVEDETGVHVHLYGCAHYAPGQYDALRDLARELQPQALVLEQPLVSAPPRQHGGRQALLPYPSFIDALAAARDSLAGGGTAPGLGGTGDDDITGQVADRKSVV